MAEPVGIIYPPPNLRGIVDKAATFVAKHGDTFEAKIKNEQQGNSKFSFLFPNDPFNAYYKHKVNEIRSSLLSNSRLEQSRSVNERQAVEEDNGDNHKFDEAHQGKESEGTSNVKKQNDNCDTKESAQDQQDDNEDLTNRQHMKPQLDKYIQEKTLKLEEPPPLNYLASPTSTISHFDCDVIKLTSQFIATYGRSFLLELVSREQSNSLFDFLKPQHGQFPYMTNLIMQYALIQNPPLDILEHLEKDANNQKHVLERIRIRAEWNRMLEIERKRREEAAEREKELYNQIDWYDFVIVETVDYQPEDKGEYPPTTADQVGTRLLKQQRLEDLNNPEEMEIDMDVESDQESADGKEGAGDEFMAPPPPDASKVNIRKDYDPKAATKATPMPENYYVSPITNERMPAGNIDKHLRYNLADPRYLEKKEQILQGKMAEEEVFASGSQIQDSLKNLAERRTDIFGTNDAETAIGQRIGEEENQLKKDDKIIWDGHKSSLKKKKLN